MNDQAAEHWATDGRRVWRAPGGPTVCVMGDPGQGSLFDDATDIQARDAAMVACAPRLVTALEECAKRLETCCHFSGSAAEYAVLAVKQYRDLIALARGRHPKREGT